MLKNVTARLALCALSVVSLAGMQPVLAQDTVTIGSFVSTSGSGAPFGVDQLQGMDRQRCCCRDCRCSREDTR